MGAPGSERRELDVSDEDAGLRLDRFLAKRVPEHSRSFLARLIAEGEVRVDGLAARPAEILKAGHRVSLRIPPPEPLELEPEAIPLDILYEDDDLAVVDKPAGLVAHPAAGHRKGTLVHSLLHHLGALSGVGGRLRPGLVHRLDKDTSGLLVVAKNDGSHRRLSESLAAREVQREYLALVWGRLERSEGRIDAPIGRDPRQRKRMAVVTAGGRPAITSYSRVDSYAGFDYIRLKLGTGRTHQIRVHMAHLGHPVLGDPLYGGRRSRMRGRSGAERALCRQLLSILERQALHAWRLRFEHPVSGEWLEFESPLHRDMQDALALLRDPALAEGESG
jgi:23S rRNA pseudouridine1911/1915/1917 synthase